MGDCVRTIQTDSHERHHDVYVWQQSANLQHHDGFHALQGSYPRPALDQHGLCKVRDRWDPYQVEGRQGCLRFNAVITARVGRVEGEYNGTVTVRFPSFGLSSCIFVLMSCCCLAGDLLLSLPAPSPITFWSLTLIMI